MVNENGLVVKRTIPLTEAQEALPDNFRAALNYMKARNFMRSRRHAAQHYEADRTGVDPQIIEFERAFVHDAAKLEIPLFAPIVARRKEVLTRMYVLGKTRSVEAEDAHASGTTIQIMHGVHQDDLPSICWDLIGHIGRETASRIGMKVRWGGDIPGGDKSRWWLLEPTPVLDPQLPDNWDKDRQRRYSEEVYRLDQGDKP